MASSSSQPHQPNPELIFETFNAYQRSNALHAAIELDLFTAIAEGATTAAALATRLKVAERGARILCDYLTVIGFLTKENGQWALTPDSAIFLDRRSPAYMGTMSGFLKAPGLKDTFSDLAAVVRKGGSLGGGTIAPENPVWVEFARSMVPLMAMPADFIAGVVGADSGAACKVLDIAAGHGIFGVTIARRNPNARIVGLDWGMVLEVAKENAAKAGVADRYETIAGSAFDVDFGRDYDFVLLTNFLHHFNPATNEALLRKVHAALKPGGKAVTLEFVPNEDRISPPAAATFSLMMLGSTPAGDAYTFAELEAMFRNAGFGGSQAHKLPGPQTVIVSEK
jgi:hypothetical protein